MSEEFDFDYWMNLAKTDPEGYYDISNSYMHTYIDNRYGKDTPESNRLKGTLWKVQQSYRKIVDPVVRANKATDAMFVVFHEFNEELKKLVGVTDELRK